MRSAALTLALLIILSGAAPATALVSPGVDDGQELTPAAALATTPAVAQVDADTPPSTEIRIQLQSDTDARWTITYRYALTGEDEREAFRALGDEFESGQSNVAFDASAFRSIAAEASRSTGRTMSIRDVTREASIDQNTTVTATETGAATSTSPTPSETATGVLQLSFTWTNFLERTEDGTLQLGDVFTTSDGGTWLSSLGDDQRITVVTPPEYVISRTSFPIQQQNGSLIIDGPREFTQNERLEVTYRESGRAELPWTLIIGGGVAAVVVLAVAFAFVRSRDGSRSRSSETTGNGGTAMTNGGETTADGQGQQQPTGVESGASTETTSSEAVTTAPETGVGEAGDTGDEADDTDEAEAEPDFDLLSDEERVEYLLEQRGGRMKQANIVKETGWSDAKVSQLLSSMAEAGRVEKLRLGRENLISIPDADEASGEGDADE